MTFYSAVKLVNKALETVDICNKLKLTFIALIKVLCIMHKKFCTVFDFLCVYFDKNVPKHVYSVLCFMYFNKNLLDIRCEFKVETCTILKNIIINTENEMK